MTATLAANPLIPTIGTPYSTQLTSILSWFMGNVALATSLLTNLHNENQNHNTHVFSRSNMFVACTSWMQLITTVAKHSDRPHFSRPFLSGLVRAKHGEYRVGLTTEKIALSKDERVGGIRDWMALEKAGTSDLTFDYRMMDVAARCNFVKQHRIDS
ncbi:hypothetical protein BC936DRAFT_138647 [Jimgerdemannia flammicorona]|uniref:Uncharacterized protein n=1 Tax=Jimgerdemannia flammicorona TaxID=994334 RepID=A0A433DIA8_9FUNG|nr:hypothetical protein BC936DRAFT_138647 [Jimgerdemannia flammicorona]